MSKRQLTKQIKEDNPKRQKFTLTQYARNELVKITTVTPHHLSLN